MDYLVEMDVPTESSGAYEQGGVVGGKLGRGGPPALVPVLVRLVGDWIVNTYGIKSRSVSCRLLV